MARVSVMTSCSGVWHALKESEEGRSKKDLIHSRQSNRAVFALYIRKLPRANEKCPKKTITLILNWDEIFRDQ